MASKSPEKQGEPKGRQQRDDFLTAVGRRVLDTLGQPHNLYSVLVRWLWEDYYRVNIVVGGDPSSVKIAHSFFLETDHHGNIIDSDPRLTKQYATLAERQPRGKGDIEIRGD